MVQHRRRHSRGCYRRIRPLHIHQHHHWASYGGGSHPTSNLPTTTSPLLPTFRSARYLSHL